MSTRTIEIDDQVRLTCNIPELALHRGAVGVVCSTWNAPIVGFEVEFRTPGAPFGIHTLIREEQIEMIENKSIRLTSEGVNHD